MEKISKNYNMFFGDELESLLLEQLFTITRHKFS